MEKSDIVKEMEKMMKEIEQLRMDKEDMYQLATRADWYESDWKEFERIFDK